MSRETIDRIVGRALLDRPFLEALLRQPEAALAGYDLSAEEQGQIAETVRGLSPEEARKLAAAFESQVATRKAAAFG